MGLQWYIIQPEVCEHLTITTDVLAEHPFPKPCAKLRWSPFAFITASIFPGSLTYKFWNCQDVCAFSNYSSSLVQHWCWTRSPGAQGTISVHPKSVHWGWGQVTWDLSHQHQQSMSLWILLCAQGYCPARLGLCYEVLTVHLSILYCTVPLSYTGSQGTWIKGPGAHGGGMGCQPITWYNCTHTHSHITQ